MAHVAVVDFKSLRADWFGNGNFMARTLQRQLRQSVAIYCFVGFPRHWLPIFAWAGAKWKGSTEPSNYVPLFSGRSEFQIAADIERARAAGQLRHLAEVAGSADVTLCETLQRIDDQQSSSVVLSRQASELSLTTWHSYSRAEVKAFDTIIASFKQSRENVLFMPCAKTRPYHRSRAHKRLLDLAIKAGLDLDDLDKIVITSIGPVPESFWDADLVQRYNTGVRDIYRLYLQTRTLLRKTRYSRAWDLNTFVPYSDILRLVYQDGLLPEPERLPGIRRRNIPAFRHKLISVL